MSERVIGLEGMRGIAALVVFLHHFLLIFHPDFYFGAHSWANLLLNPNLAVAWFFAHSGFVLAWGSRDLEKKAILPHILNHALRRYLRLLPLVLISILLTWLFLKAKLIFSIEYAETVGSTWLARYLKFDASISDAFHQAFWGVYFKFASHNSFNPNLWTIGHELISSYLLFLGVLLFKTGKKSCYVFSMIAFLVGPWKGVLPFFLGAALTRLPEHRAPKVITPIITLLSLLLADFTGTLGDYLRGISSAGLMYVLIQSPNIRRVLSKKIPEFLGRISYALYAIHFLVLVTFTSWIGKHFNSHESLLKMVLNFFTTGLILIATSYLLYVLVDRPGIKFSKWTARKLVSKLKIISQ